MEVGVFLSQPPIWELKSGVRRLAYLDLGKIGFELAKRCAYAFDMKIIYHNRGHHEEAEKELGATWVSFSELLEKSDVLSVNTALTPETKGKFNKEVFHA